VGIPRLELNTISSHTAAMKDLSTWISETGQAVNEALAQYLPPPDTRPAVLHKAMHYSVFAGGKRLRPLLCIAAAEAVCAPAPQAVQPACAIEILHTYSLIHDDLPAMDDDDLRRGKPACHKAFGEANAILAGDALLTLAFEWLSNCAPTPPGTPAQLVAELARAAGHTGMIAGQVEDIAAEGQDPDAETVTYIHATKTGALIRAALRIGGLSAGSSPEQLKALTIYGEKAGQAFQLIDDLLNVESNSATMGKPVGNDEARGKMTFVRLHGIDFTRQQAQRLTRLAELAEYMLRRIC
jgi:geranylgeranyl diphosphate synthase type II